MHERRKHEGACNSHHAIKIRFSNIKLITIFLLEARALSLKLATCMVLYCTCRCVIKPGYGEVFFIVGDVLSKQKHFPGG